MPLQSDSPIVEVEIWDLCLPVAHVCTTIYISYMCAFQWLLSWLLHNEELSVINFSSEKITC